MVGAADNGEAVRTVHVPGALAQLWSPHRLAYVTGDQEPRSGYRTRAGCPFCRAPKMPDEEGLVVARGDTVYALLNLYPYNSGHLMVCPYRHVADYPDLTTAEATELASFTQQAMRVIRQVSGPDGFNVGMNQGAAAGAGIAAHLHQHLVPRWSGDTNFMPVIAQTKVLPQLLADTRDRIATAWSESEAGVARRRPAKAPARAAAAAGRASSRRSITEKESTASQRSTRATESTGGRGGKPRKDTTAARRSASGESAKPEQGSGSAKPEQGRAAPRGTTVTRRNAGAGGAPGRRSRER